MDQVDPFHDSTSVLSTVPSLEDPAAVHAAGPVHDTARRSLLCDAEPLGLGTMDQVDPFHDSISVWSAVPLKNWPTAVHAAGPGHEMPNSSLSCDAEASGLGTMDQVDPFHDSISVWSAAPLKNWPTAMHAAGPVHDTPLRSL